MFLRYTFDSLKELRGIFQMWPTSFIQIDKLNGQCLIKEYGKHCMQHFFVAVRFIEPND